MLLRSFIPRQWRGASSLPVADRLIGLFVSVISSGIAVFTRNAPATNVRFFSYARI